MSALHSFNLSWKYSFVVAGLFVASFLPLRGQRVAVKTNLLVDATTTFNLGVELALHPKWTLDISGSYNPWTFRDNRKWQHWLVQPEARYWFCQKMSGNFAFRQDEINRICTLLDIEPAEIGRFFFCAKS